MMSFRVGLKEYDNCEVLCIFFVKEIQTSHHNNLIISYTCTKVMNYVLIAQNQTKGLL